MKNKSQPDVQEHYSPSYTEIETSTRAFDGATVKWRRRKISPWEWSAWTIISVTPKKD